MKAFYFTITLILSLPMYAQTELEASDIFVRVYNLEGKKIGKGKIIKVSETALYLRRNRKSKEIPVSHIGSIRTKHSVGNNALLGAVVGGTLMAIIGSGASDSGSFAAPSTPGEGLLIGAVMGGFLGAPIGGLTAIFKKSKTFEINGDIEKLKAFKEVLNLKQ